jgi:hypothetical protein
LRSSIAEAPQSFSAVNNSFIQGQINNHGLESQVPAIYLPILMASAYSFRAMSNAMTPTGCSSQFEQPAGGPSYKRIGAILLNDKIYEY